MKKIVLALLFGLVLSAQTAFSAGLTFHGQLSDIKGTSEECKNFFDEADYEVKHYLVGANHRTSVVGFSSSNPKSFLHKTTLVGLMGPDNDIQVTKQKTAGDKKIQITADGYVTPDFILLDIRVQVLNAQKQVVCKASAEFSAFN